MLVLVWFLPLSILAWLAGQAVILLQRRWHWWRFTLAALAWIGGVLAVDRPGGGPAPSHLRARRFSFAPSTSASARQEPASPLASSSGTWSSPRCGWLYRSGCWPRRCRSGTPNGAAGGAEWSPSIRRRQRIDQRTRDRRPTPRPQAHRPRPRGRLGRRPGQLAPRPLRRPTRPAAGQGHGRGRRPRGPARPSPCYAWRT